ncbi:MAG: hypothetical protein M1824_000158 [Vezdaea acicularis]|nr:MAG: hypothetical protein M1824_000158 [Vezdaea acicularis]
MGFFSSSPKPKTSADGMPEAPDRTQRAQCWKARDAFFACLDTHGIIDSIEHSKEAARDCGSDLKAFESNCASSWVVYFKKRRVMEHKRAETLAQLAREGAQQIPGQIEGGAGSPSR